MLDSGSEVNIIRQGLIPEGNFIDYNKKSLIKGVGAKPLQTIGVVRIKIVDMIIEFLVVPTTFPIPHHGILGVQFFLNNDAKIDFSTSSLLIGDKSIRIHQNLDPSYEVEENRIANLESDDSNGTLPYIDMLVSASNKTGRFLIDTGSEGNLIKRGLIPQNCDIDNSNQYYLRGVGTEIVPTLGTLKLRLFGYITQFHVVPDNCDITESGIIGASYFTKSGSVIDFNSRTLIVDGKTEKLKFDSSRDNFENNSNYSLLVNKSDGESYEESGPYGFSTSENNWDSTSDAMKHICLISEAEVFQDLGITNTTEQVSDFRLYSAENSVSVFNLRENSIRDLVRTDHLDLSQKQYILDLVEKNRDVFFLPGDSLPGTDIVTHRIPTTDDIPINSRQYKFPHALKDEINRQVEELLGAGIIKHSNSPYNTPLWIVPKKPDSQGRPRWRMVLDFRSLNDKTISDAYPLPNITEIFDQVGGAKYYSVLDLASGFHQIKMHPEDAHKTAFSTPFGHYEFVRMPFGLKNAPASFQRLMDDLLRGLQGIILFVYLDDIVIYSNTLQEHEKKINLLFSRLRKAGLKLQIDKCEFLKTEVNYLGHVLSEKGLSPDPKKIEAVRKFPQPKNVKNVRQFLGLAGYYRRFIKDFAKISKPLTKLLQKDTPFAWTEKATESFETLKTFLCNAPLLQFPDLTKSFNITTDASGYAIGGVLSQGEIGKDRPIAYTSRVLRGPELNYEIYEKEALAIVHSVKTFKSYIYGRKITIITDHQPLVWFKTADLNTRVQKWRFKLSEYDYQIIYKPGKLNSNADALSRNPPEEIPINIMTRAQTKLNNNDNNPNQDLASTLDPGPPTSIHEGPLLNPIMSANNPDPIPVSSDNMSPNPNLNLKTKKPRGRPRKNIETPVIDRYPKRDKTKPNYMESDIEDENEIDAEPNAITKIFGANPEFNLPSISGSIAHSDSEYDCDSQTDSNITRDSKTSSINKLNNNRITETKDLIHFRTDNVAYFVSTDNEPCDEGAKKLFTNKKVNLTPNLSIGEVQKTPRSNNKFYFALCIKNQMSESIQIIKENLSQSLIILRSLLLESNQNEISFAKTNQIENLPWEEIIKIMKFAFEDSNIKIIICNGSLKYVPLEKRDEIFYELHKSPVGGHKGVSKTYNRIKQNFYWENLKADVQRRIQQCLDCQLKKLVRLKTKQPMMITDTPGVPFEKIAMDIVGPLRPTKNGNGYILTMQDQLSKFCLAVPLADTLSSTIADAFIKKFICTFGAPKIILTDQGKNFLSSLMNRVAKRFKIKKIRTTAFHPQSNGSLERSHHSLGEFLKQYTNSDEEWDTWVDIAMLNYNTCVQESTRYTPFEIIFGRLARLPSSDPLREADLVPTYKGYIEELVARLNSIQKMAYDNLVQSKFQSKKYYDRKINPKNFKVGDYVYLLNGPKPGKLGDHYTGPHKILELINKTNVKIQFKNSTKIVHANRLRISHINPEVTKVQKRGNRGVMI